MNRRTSENKLYHSVPNKGRSKLNSKNITSIQSSQDQVSDILPFERKQRLYKLNKQQQKLIQEYEDLEKQEQNIIVQLNEVKRYIDKNERYKQEQVKSTKYLQLQRNLLLISCMMYEQKRLKVNKPMNYQEKSKISNELKLTRKLQEIKSREQYQLEKIFIKEQYEKNLQPLKKQRDLERRLDMSQKLNIFEIWEKKSQKEIEKMKKKNQVTCIEKCQQILNEQQQLKRLEQQFQNQQDNKRKHKLASAINYQNIYIEQLQKRYLSIKLNNIKEEQDADRAMSIQRSRRLEEIQFFKIQINTKYENYNIKLSNQFKEIEQQYSKRSQSQKSIYEKEIEQLTKDYEDKCISLNTCYQAGFKFKNQKDYDFSRHRFYEEIIQYRPQQIQIMQKQFNSIQAFINQFEEKKKIFKEKNNDLAQIKKLQDSNVYSLTQIKQKKIDIICCNQKEKQRRNYQFY